MSALAIDSPLPTYIGLDGQPLSNGYVYFGVEDQDPRTYSVPVFWDEAMTIPAAQPIRTNGGYLYRNGAPARVWVDGGYSTMVLDAKRRQVLYAATALQITAATLPFLQLGAGAVERPVLDKLRDIVNVADFGAVGDGVADDTPSIQAAINYIKSVGGGTVDFVPRATYRTTYRISISGNFGGAGITLRGNKATILANGNDVAILALPCGVSSGDAAEGYRQNSVIQDLFISGPGMANVASVGVQIQQGAGVQVRNCNINGFYRGLHGYGALICSFHNLLIEECAYGIDFIPTTPSGAPYDPQFHPNDVHFYDIQVIGCTRAVRVTNFPAGAVTFTSCELEGNNPTGNAADGVRVIEFFDAGKVSLYSCHLEENFGEYNLYFHGNNAFTHLNLIGCEIIPGDLCGNGVYLSNASGVANAANAAIIGTRITTNVGNQLYVCEGFNVVIEGDIFGGIQGHLERVTLLTRGKIGVGGKRPSFASLLATGDAAFGVAADFNGIVRVVDAAEARLMYLQHTGTTGGLLVDVGTAVFGVNAGPRLMLGGAGTPEGVVTAAVGSMYTRTDGGAATTLYIKESGAGNTGWVAK